MKPILFLVAKYLLATCAIALAGFCMFGWPPQQRRNAIDWAKRAQSKYAELPNYFNSDIAYIAEINSDACLVQKYYERAFQRHRALQWPKEYGIVLTDAEVGFDILASERQYQELSSYFASLLDRLEQQPFPQHHICRGVWGSMDIGSANSIRRYLRNSNLALGKN